MRPTQAPQAATSVSRRPGAQDGEHGAHHRIRDHGGVSYQPHLDLALLVLGAVVDLLGVDYAVAAEQALQIRDDAGRDDLPRRQKGDVVHGPAGRSFDDLLQSLGFDRILLVGELQHLHFVDHGAGAPGQLLGDVTAFEPGGHVKAVLADDAGHLFNREIGIAAQVGNVAAVVFVGEDEAHGVAGALKRGTHTARAGFELFARGHVLAFDGRRVFEDPDHGSQIAGVIDGRHCECLVRFRALGHALSLLHRARPRAHVPPRGRGAHALHQFRGLQHVSKRQRGRPFEPDVESQPADHDLDDLERPRPREQPDLVPDNGQHDVLGEDEIAAEDHDLRVQQADRRRQSGTDRPSGPLEHRLCDGVAAAGAFEHVDEAELARCRAGVLGIPAENVGAGRDRLQAAALPAVAQILSAGDELAMSDLA
jgi:hypothetical protein